LGSGVQPQVLLALHAAPPSQTMQSMGTPQLSGIMPQRPLHQFGSRWQTHWLLITSQTRFAGQLLMHWRATPQLSRPGPQWVVHQLGSEHASPPSCELASPASRGAASRPASPASLASVGASPASPGFPVSFDWVPSKPTSTPTSEPVVTSPEPSAASMPSSLGKPSLMPRIEPQADGVRAHAIARAASAVDLKRKRSPRTMSQLNLSSPLPRVDSGTDKSAHSLRARHALFSHGGIQRKAT
jgi:hypothetical protein